MTFIAKKDILHLVLGILLMLNCHVCRSSKEWQGGGGKSTGKQRKGPRDRLWDE